MTLLSTFASRVPPPNALRAAHTFSPLSPSPQQPAQSALPALLKDTSEAIGEITSFRESNRRSPQFNHLSAISEGIPALGWVTMEPKPAPFVKEMKDAAQFYTNVCPRASSRSLPRLPLPSVALPFLPLTTLFFDTPARSAC